MTSPVSRFVFSLSELQMAEYFALVPREPPKPGLRPAPAIRAGGRARARPSVRSPSLVRAVGLGVAEVLFAFPLRIGACGRAKLRMSVFLASKSVNQPALAQNSLQLLLGFFISCPPYPRFRLGAVLLKVSFSDRLASWPDTN